jgi:hypothetical protein
MWFRDMGCYIFDMATPPAVDVITATSAVIDVTPTALVVAICTLQAAVTASRERTVGTIVAAGTPAGTTAGTTVAARPHPLVGPPSVTADASTPAGTTGSLAVVVVVGTPAGTVVGTVVDHPPADLLFLVADASAPASPTAGVTGPLDAAIVVGAPAAIAMGVAGP